MSPAAAPSSTDGRVARGERTRTAIVAAFLDLLTEGSEQPTSREIAGRAGVSVRSIFQHFEDLESVRVDVVRIQSERLRPLLGSLRADGDRDERVSALVAQRARLFEYIAPLRRAMEGIDRSEVITRGRAELSDLLDRQATDQFHDELQSIPRGRRPAVRAALAAVGSYEYWDQLRRVQGLTEAAARRALAEALDALVPH